MIVLLNCGNLKLTRMRGKRTWTIGVENDQCVPAVLQTSENRRPSVLVPCGSERWLLITD